MKKTNVVIESQNSEVIERHLQTLKAISDTVNHLRLEVEAKKIESKVNSDAIQTWNDDVDSKLQAADVEIGRIRKWVRDREKEAEINAKKEQMQFEEEIQKMKLQLKADQQAKTKSQNEGAGQDLSSCGVQAKLPKLVITKFDVPTWIGHVFGDNFRRILTRQVLRRSPNSLIYESWSPHRLAGP